MVKKNFPDARLKQNIQSIWILLLSRAVRYISGVLLAGVILLGCSSTTQTFIKDKTVSVEVPQVKEIITEVEPVNFDSSLTTAIETYATDSTYYKAHTVNERGVEVKAKLILKDKDTQKPKLDIEVTQPDVIYSYTDTTQHTTIKEANSPGDYLVYLVILAVIVAGIILIIKLKR
ncbi:hypothetical protein IT417_01530 [bacterium]|nr:hypothetical protein [bacterium]